MRPLYKLSNNCNFYETYNLFGFASELKCLEYFYNLDTSYFNLEQFEPGTYSYFEFTNFSKPIWNPVFENKPYYLPSFSHTRVTYSVNDLENEFYHKISYYLNLAVVKRCITTERPIACLLSGGLDSSLIASLVSNYFRKKNKQI